VRWNTKKLHQFTNKWLAERIAARGARSFMEINKELIDLQTKYDELAELVAWYFECSDYYWHDDFLWQHGAPSVQGCAYDELTESYKAAEAALRKAVEEK
jgi:hypothetical protein